ncbi:ABC transporter ATP-binding protein [Spirochaetia bacterium]|nr:ABC transporter ATP-binding protein [Spirochaetia bacterium]
MSAFLKLISLFSKKKRRQLVPITIVIIISALLEMAGIGSMAPFMAVISDTSIIKKQKYLSYLYDLLKFEDTGSFLIFIGVAFFIIVCVSTILKMIVSNIVYRYTANGKYELESKLFKMYLSQPYQYFLDRNTGELSKKILNEIDLIIAGVLGPAMDFFVSFFLILATFVLLIIINPLVSIIACILFGGLYAVLFGIVRPRLISYGNSLDESNFLRFKSVAEAFGGIKDIKILGKESYYWDMYKGGAKLYTTSQSKNQILSSVPSRTMQPLAVGFGIVLVLILLRINRSLDQILPLLAVYAFAIMRMMPLIQGVFHEVANIRYYGRLVDILYEEMTSLSQSCGDSGIQPMGTDRVPFSGRIDLKNLQFSYHASNTPAIKNINLSIIKNNTIGLVGTTGCGKTTLVDVIMGLLIPSGGEILADDIPVITSDIKYENRPLLNSWQRNFGYVSQQIFLCDDTIAANIALGIPEKDRNVELIEYAAQTANLHNFITRDLPEGYNTTVGERGIRLSGGQRQRIGIARALYHDPPILVMDEATSALDSITEDAVMDAIHNLKHSKTIIIIAHRLSTVRECDKICLMEDGNIIDMGTYDYLIENNAKFKNMAKIVEQPQ